MLSLVSRPLFALGIGVFLLAAGPTAQADNVDATPANPPKETPLSEQKLPPGGHQLNLQPTNFTPYDRYMTNVRKVIENVQHRMSTMDRACELVEQGRQFKYVMGNPYYAKTPAMTAMDRAGDCKDKALWLFNALGDPNALYVIGKATKRNPNSHAWVYWWNENRWWILDCTNRSEPLAADTVGEDAYIPYYSFGRYGAYRHKATFLLTTPGGANAGAAAVGDQGGAQRAAR